MEKCRKTEIKIFTIADYEEEEIWLREQHRQGLVLLYVILFIHCGRKFMKLRKKYRK